MPAKEEPLIMIDEHEERHIIWQVYCPRCLTPQQQGHVQHGLATVVRHFACPTCRKSFDVRSRVGGDGAPLCEATPVFIRSPEVLEDNDPPVLP